MQKKNDIRKKKEHVFDDEEDEHLCALLLWETNVSRSSLKKFWEAQSVGECLTG